LNKSTLAKISPTLQFKRTVAVEAKVIGLERPGQANKVRYEICALTVT